MIKGSERKVIFIPGAKDSAFEAAYFMLRVDVGAPAGTDRGAGAGLGADRGREFERDILREANRIIEERASGAPRPEADPRAEKTKAAGRLRAALCFLFGGVFGAAVVFCVELLL